MTMTSHAQASRTRLALPALALGSFTISTSEFASMGLLPLFAGELGLDVPHATHAITAYALGVVVGAPLLTLAAARMDRRMLLIALMLLAAVANVASALAPDLGLLVLGRFLSGLPQGAYFGAAAVVATRIVGSGRSGSAVAVVMGGITLATVIGAPAGTWIGQEAGWRLAYALIGALSLLSLVALGAGLPRLPGLAGGSVRGELAALTRANIWIMIVITALAIASTFGVYTFVGPLVSGVAGMEDGMVPLALVLIGLGMAVGNVIGGRLADIWTFRAIGLGFGVTMAVLALMGLLAANGPALMVLFFCIGVAVMIGTPSIPVRMMHMAPEAPTLMGALNMAAFNVANAIGAAAGGLTIEAGLGLTSPIWAGLALTGLGLALFAVAYRYLNATRDGAA
ncbi:MFS transporter [Oceanicella sp. SM1341]|uniref:MFS transporter n=1 Tax=Oceanicella sp. SM1341 TaxID=1548889 RepID=UPI000E49A222|nr:MFS transporter [Oceanicella sp. SM1341]